MDITIVTPSFNQVRFLAKTIESVLRQEGDFRLDYIVMDGGSTDGSTGVLQQYEREIQTGQRQLRFREVNFRWFSEPDRGQANAVNKGFALAQGKYLGWLNSDDIFASRQTLSKVLDFFKTNPHSSFVYGRGYRINETGVFQGEENYITRYGIGDLLEVDYILQPSAFWAKSLFEQTGPLDEDMHYAFDWDFWIRCSQFTKLDFVDEVLSCNRVYGQTKTNSGGIKRKAEIAKMLLRHGGFTQRAINNYLAEYHHSAPAAAPGTATFKQRLRPYLAPGRWLERQVRLRGRAMLRFGGRVSRGVLHQADLLRWRLQDSGNEATRPTYRTMDPPTPKVHVPDEFVA
jgi:glycosyltransferase involved in cell wall biosynthesis